MSSIVVGGAPVKPQTQIEDPIAAILGSGPGATQTAVAAPQDQVVAPSATEALAPAPALDAAAENLMTLRQEALAIVKDRGQLAVAEKMAASVDFTNLIGIGAFGISVQDEISALAQALTTSIRNDKAGEAGETIREVMRAVNGFDRKIELPEMNWLKGLFNKAKAGKQLLEDYWQRYQPVEGQIAAMGMKLQRLEGAIKAQEAQTKVLQEKSLASLDKFTLCIAALGIALDNLENKVLPALEQKAAASPTDARLSQEIAVHRQAVSAIDQRITEIIAQRTFNEQQVASAGMMRESAAQTVNRLVKVRQNIVPLFYQLCFQSAVLFTQKEGLQVAEDVVQGFNKLMEESAKNLRQQYVAAAKASTSVGISADSLVKVAQELVGGLNDAAAVAKQDRQVRAEAEAKMKQAREALGNALVGKTLPGPSTPTLNEQGA